METPKTLLEAIRQFSDPDVAREFVVRLRWPNGVACPRVGCGSADVQWISTRKLWRCKECKRQFTAKVGTIFEDSPIGFDKWLPAMWLLSANKNGISSLELSRALGVTQKTAWFMLHRIRLAMKTKTFQRLTGEVEADETYIGGKLRHRRRPLPGRSGNKAVGPVGKTPVMGIMKRGGEIRAFVVPNARKTTLLPRIFEHVERGSTMYTDSLHAYTDLQSDYVHEVVNHAIEYVRGNAHTNNLENFWSVLKRTLGGTYIAARPAHLDRYLDEQLFRFNTSEMADSIRFRQAISAADGLRLTYKKLIGKG